MCHTLCGRRHVVLLHRVSSRRSTARVVRASSPKHQAMRDFDAALLTRTMVCNVFCLLYLACNGAGDVRLNDAPDKCTSRVIAREWVLPRIEQLTAHTRNMVLLILVIITVRQSWRYQPHSCGAFLPISTPQSPAFAAARASSSISFSSYLSRG